MELTLSGNALKTFSRSITSLARIGNELVIQAFPTHLTFHTLNSSRSAYHSITFKPLFFDLFTLHPSSSPLIQCSLLLKSLCSILRTPISVIDRLSALLPSPDAPKIQWTLHCHNGVKKTYWISCNVEPDIQHLSLDRRRFPSSLVVRPRDLTRLLSNFQSSLQEITVIATQPSLVPVDAVGEIGGKAVELRSYIDPTKDESDSALHTQLWIDPSEEFLQYTHAGDAVDITFGMKELKAFLSFCEGCEVDIHLFFEKAGEPILLAPRFGLDDGSNSDFDATLVLATMLVSQLAEVNTTEQPHAASVPHAQDAQGNGIQSEQARAAMPSAVSEHPSGHTKIWSDLSASAAKSSDGTRDRHAHVEEIPRSSMHCDMQRPGMMNVSKVPLARENVPDMYPHVSSMQYDMQRPGMMNASKAPLARENVPDIRRQPMDADCVNEPQGGAEMNRNPNSQHYPSNWVGGGEDNEEEDEDDELYVQATPEF